ncbi:MAG TPA: MFS transporter [Verrucomicrobiales bacterium]|nr:MFS transporter [Verrucomicrobiales bacterium]
MTALAQAAPAAEPVTRARFVLAVVALATGGFAIGTTEFVTMGLLTQIAGGIGVTIPQAGHLISAYALGVVVGAPTLAALGARLPRRALLVWLMVAYAVLNLLSAAVSHYGLLAFVRFLDGLPHGAYFGVSALVASGMVSPERRGRALALVMMGIPVANLAGVPAATLLGQAYGWRAAYVAVGLVSVLTVVMILLFVPSTPGDATATGRRELAALRHPQLWYAVGAGAIGFGGLFALVSYIAPITTDVGGLPESAVAVFLLVLGVGMVGHGAGELIAEATLAIEMGATAFDIASTVHPHPTLSETLMEAAEAFYGTATHVLGKSKQK